MHSKRTSQDIDPLFPLYKETTAIAAVKTVECNFFQLIQGGTVRWTIADRQEQPKAFKPLLCLVIIFLIYSPNQIKLIKSSDFRFNILSFVSYVCLSPQFSTQTNRVFTKTQIK